MKPIIAIVEPAQIDLALIEQQITVEIGGVRDDLRMAERYDKQAESARESAKRRRLRIGELLTKARPAWPPRGPAPKESRLPAGAPASWAEFLTRLKLDDATARRYMDEYKDPEGFAQKQAKLEDPDDDRPSASPADDDEPERVHGQPVEPPPFRQMTKADWIQGLGRLPAEERKEILAAAGPPAAALALTPDPTTANVHGGSGERKRGSYCTPKKLAHAVGPFDVDPFSNPRSHIAAVDRCMLENGGDGLVVGEPGSYRVGADGAVQIASATTRVWIQPDYRIVLKAIAHYGHTRFSALLRFAPDTRWFRAMWPRVAVVAVPPERIPFETPDGIEIVGADEGEDAGAPFPHVLYYADARDVTDEIAQTCILLNRYEALRLVR